MLIQAARALHGIAPLRSVARKTLSRVTMRVRFWGGAIFCNVVDHSGLWLNGSERADRGLQDALSDLARSHECFLDIGANIGLMSLSVALRNPSVRVVAVEPSERVAPLLERSIAANALTQRVELLRAAVTDHDGQTYFEESGPLIGHVGTRGRPVACVDLRAVLNTALARHRRVLAKLDVEGLETSLLPLLSDVPDRERLTMVIEIHPRGSNDVGDPRACLQSLLDSGATCHTLAGQPVDVVDESTWTQVVASWGKIPSEVSSA